MNSRKQLECKICRALVFCTHRPPQRYAPDQLPCANCLGDFSDPAEHADGRCVQGSGEYLQPLLPPLELRMLRATHFSGYAAKYLVVWRCLNCTAEDKIFVNEPFERREERCRGCKLVTTMTIHPSGWSGI